LATYHNLVTDDRPGLYEVFVDGEPVGKRLRPTSKVHADADAACSYLEFTAAGKPVVVSFRSPGREVIVNGFEIDTPDPNRKAIKPSPADDDEHADADSGSLVLAWTAREAVDSHDVYLGDDRGAVASAGR